MNGEVFSNQNWEKLWQLQNVFGAMLTDTPICSSA